MLVNKVVLDGGTDPTKVTEQNTDKTLDEKRRQEAAAADQQALQKLEALKPPQWLAAEIRAGADGAGIRPTALGVRGELGNVWSASFVTPPSVVPAQLRQADAPEAQAAAIQKIERALEAFQKDIFQTGEKHGAAVGSGGEFGRLGVANANLSALSLGSVELRNLAMLGQLEGLLEDPLVKGNPELRKAVEFACYKMGEVVEQERKAREREEITRAFAASEARQRGMDLGFGDLKMPAAGNIYAGWFGGQGVAVAA